MVFVFLTTMGVFISVIVVLVVVAGVGCVELWCCRGDGVGDFGGCAWVAGFFRW